jgi:hypothetical protein
VERTWLDAIIRVLREAQTPLEYAEISQRIRSQGYYQTDGATPHATVNAQIAASIEHEGVASPFVRFGRGTFGLNDAAAATAPPPQLVPSTSNAAAQVTEVEVESSDAIIRSFGMYWQRDLVVWRSDAMMFGKQQAMAKSVDFGKQRGIYILYDQHTVV